MKSELGHFDDVILEFPFLVFDVLGLVELIFRTVRRYHVCWNWSHSQVWLCKNITRRLGALVSRSPVWNSVKYCIYVWIFRRRSLHFLDSLAPIIEIVDFLLFLFSSSSSFLPSLLCSSPPSPIFDPPFWMLPFRSTRFIHTRRLTRHVHFNR